MPWIHAIGDCIAYVNLFEFNPERVPGGSQHDWTSSLF